MRQPDGSLVYVTGSRFSATQPGEHSAQWLA